MPNRRKTSSRRKRAEPDLRQRVLDHFEALGIPLGAEQLDAATGRAEAEGLSHLQLLDALVGEQADGRRQRRIERRIREACFSEPKTLEAFDWEFNTKAIDRVQMENLASGEFIGRGENLVFVGQSGVGKSHLIQAIGREACVLDHRVRYTSSASLLNDLIASLADGSLRERLRYYERLDLLIIDGLGFEHVERQQNKEATSLLYKIVDARAHGRSTALVTNVDFDQWSEYLGDATLAMAILDRLVDRATIVKMKGRSYRAHRTKTGAAAESG